MRYATKRDLPKQIGGAAEVALPAARLRSLRSRMLNATNPAKMRPALLD
eukprot:gene8135-2711_t